MNFESLDWRLEAQRVTQAFEIDQKCYFTKKKRRDLVPRNAETEYVLCWVGIEDDDNPEDGDLKDGDNSLRPEIDDYKLLCSYGSESGRHFFLCAPFMVEIMGVDINWSGQATVHTGHREMPQHREMSLILVKALQLLGFLTPEIEAALQVTVSAHEKMQWELAHAARIDESE